MESYTDDSGALIVSGTPEKSDWGQGRRQNTTGGRNDGGRPAQKPKKLGWKELGGEFLHFSLYKENKDTMEVVSYLAHSLKLKPQSFQFAGTKDRRGVTVQRVSVYRMYADRMVPVGKTLFNAKIGNFRHEPHGLELGELMGNEFVITLRDCKFEGVDMIDTEEQCRAATDIVGTALEHLRKRGFINYFGLQRFGTYSTRTDTVGVRMLQGDFKGAVDAILDFSEASLGKGDEAQSMNNRVTSDDRNRASAIESFRTTGRSYPALEMLPRKFSAEAALIRHLGGPDRVKDYQGALRGINRNMRLMYVHAYQSLIWNLAASHRWKQHGDTVVEGDLVLIDEHKTKAGEFEAPEEVDIDGELVVHPAAGDSAMRHEDRFFRARPLTKSEVESGQYSINDVVLPTPGFDILYPKYMTTFYEETMGSDQYGGLDPHDMRRPWKDVSLSGSYRKLIAKPGNDLSFEVRAYTRDDEQFVETDLDRMFKTQAPSNGHGASLSQGNQHHFHDSGATAFQAKSNDPSPATKLAVILKLQLGSSQYATMALRELMKSGGATTYKPEFGAGR